MIPKRITTLSIATVALVGFMNSHASANLLTDPGFESANTSSGDTTTIPGWTTFNSNYVSTNYSNGGSQALKQFGQDAGAFQTFAATPGSKWTFSADVLTPSGDPLSGSEAGFLQIQFFAADGTTNLGTASGEEINSTSTPDVWTNYSIPDAVAPAGTAFVHALLFAGPHSAVGAGTPGGSVWWDNASFVSATPTPEPTSLALLGLGGLGLMARRRKATSS